MGQPGKPLSKMQVWKLKRVAWRNRIFASPRFQEWAARTPIVRVIARRRAQRVFDLVAGFAYTQSLLAVVESGLLDELARGVVTVSRIANSTSLSLAAAERLVRAAQGVNIAEEVAPGHWMLGEEGASLLNNAGARAMILHHKLLYQDLADPLALLRDDRATETALSKFWSYAANPAAAGEDAPTVEGYSDLMAVSQEMVSRQVLASYRFSGTKRLLDIGGGLGVFARSVAASHPQVEVGIFDLPGVLENTKARFLAEANMPDIALHPGDFFAGPLPDGYDTVSLVRILHDHDDEPAQHLLNTIHSALPPSGRLLIAEPMAQESGAEAMGGTYFGLYLWAMRSGRPRSSQEIGVMLERAGFGSIRRVATTQPVITSIIVATA
ncbi:methyltransferase domain-containing protein [Altererythrobacter sp. JGD-16]|uniref:Methyltransferase domain-containing protein n=2 Tax=Altererythrobacter lutimaris TaxID=2743979 RepID=A0A850HDA2_9SPHN|nr:methyltransferase domain-containing protein [Altererythrobacter lutimaris]